MARKKKLHTDIYSKLFDTYMYFNLLKEMILACAILCGEEYETDRVNLIRIFGVIDEKRSEFKEIMEKFGRMRS